jgi:hypothetical protein
MATLRIIKIKKNTSYKVQQITPFCNQSTIPEDENVISSQERLSYGADGWAIAFFYLTMGLVLFPITTQ